jgi:NAD(P)-dependent dehydrogenase (short-subunit alcohol dehydrogenase family)
MAVVLVTGANRGIGLEFVRQYAADGWKVVATCRRKKKAGDLEQVNGDVTVHELEVTDPKSVAAFVAAVNGSPVDVLVNNAGVYLDRGDELGELDYDRFTQSFEVNSVGPIRLSEALLPRVASSKRKLMVFMSTQMASITDNSSGRAYAYRGSKAALNAAVRSMSIDLKPQGIACLLLHPGWVKTEMGGKNATLDVRDSVSGMRRVIEGFTLDRTGSFLRHNGETIPW